MSQGSESGNPLQGPSRIGLVLGGGGAKGAYQIGVWRALYKAGVRKFACIAGTSIGSLNALLITTTEPDKAAEIWNDLGGILKKRTGTLRVEIIAAALYAGMALPLILLAPCVVLSVLGLVRVVSQPLLEAGVLGTMLSVCGVMIITYHARTFEFAGSVLAFSFNPHVYFRISLVVFVVLTWVNAALTSYSMKTVLIWGGSALLFWSLWSLLLLWLSKRVRSSSLYENDEVKSTISSRLNVPRSEWRADQVFATVARERIFVHPLLPTEPYSERAKQIYRLQDHPGRFSTAWVPEYVNLTNLDQDGQLITLLDTSAIPIAFPIRKDERQRWTCDGGVVDNLPIAAALNLGECDVLIVIPLNANEVPESEEAAQIRADNMWLFSVIPDLPIDEKEALRDAYQEPGEGWVEKIPGRKTLNPPRLLCVRPSKPLCTIDFPGFRFRTGTLNFSEQAISTWIRQGEEDAVAQLSLSSSGD